MNMILAKEHTTSQSWAELRELPQLILPMNSAFLQIKMMPVWRSFSTCTLVIHVGMWNSYFDAMIYLNDANLPASELVLRSILVQNIRNQNDCRYSEYCLKWQR